MAVRGIRGATTADADSVEAILEASLELLKAIVEANRVDPDEIAGVWFTTTRDLTAEFPAIAARTLGWSQVPLLCAHEMEVPGSNPRSLARCIRVLMLVNTERRASEIRFIYLRGAAQIEQERETLQRRTDSADAPSGSYAPPSREIPTALGCLHVAASGARALRAKARRGLRPRSSDRQT